MKNDLFSIGPLTIHSYGLMIALGILVCVFMGMYRARKYGYKDEAVLDIAIFGILSGFIGAKLLYVLVEFDRFLENPMDVLGSEGFVVYGGIIVGALAGVLYCRIKKLPCWEYFDLLAPSIAVAQGFGRIGCFLAGCCYGCLLGCNLSGRKLCTGRRTFNSHTVDFFCWRFCYCRYSASLQQTQ